ncbi:MAG: Jag N-terminal domain-containing protein, partial [Peptoniphilus harei]|nr:Jag N-terminal domain-containing protein [Peptoniphilus harei]
MNYVIKTGKSVDEAVREALSELNISRENAEIEVLDEGQKGFLGLIGSKDATVKVWQKEDETKSILNEIFNGEIESEKSQDAVQDNVELEIENNEVSSNDEKEVQEVIDVEESLKSIEEENEEILATAREFISKILDTLELENIVEMELDDNTLNINVNGDENRLGILIG